MKKTVKAFLSPEHFDNRTKLTPIGIAFSETINDEWRRSFYFSPDGWEATESYLDGIADRTPTKVIVNPDGLSAVELTTILERAQADHMPDEPIQIQHGIPAAFEQWTRDTEEHVREHQWLTVVAYEQETVIGYAGMEVSVVYDTDKGDATLFIQAEMVYVVPSKRKLGHGIDLSIACGVICSDLLSAIYRAAPSGTLLNCSVYADYESSGGKAFTLQLVNELSVAMDNLREMGGRKSIRFGSVNLDAGY